MLTPHPHKCGYIKTILPSILWKPYRVVGLMLMLREQHWKSADVPTHNTPNVFTSSHYTSCLRIIHIFLFNENGQIKHSVNLTSTFISPSLSNTNFYLLSVYTICCIIQPSSHTDVSDRLLFVLQTFCHRNKWFLRELTSWERSWHYIIHNVCIQCWQNLLHLYYLLGHLQLSRI